MSIVATGISYSVDENTLLDNIDLCVGESSIAVIMGPNGAGKSTLLSVLAGCPFPDKGEVFLEGKALREWPLQQLARRRVMLPQFTELAFNFSVAEVVGIGAVPHEPFVSVRDINRQLDSIMYQMDILALRDRSYITLSGGERQRTQLARVILQAVLGMVLGEVYILLDEPLAGLDIAHQQRFLKYCKQIADMGATIVMVVHDFNVPFRYAHNVSLMKAGRIQINGKTDEVLSIENIRAIFDVDMVCVTVLGTKGHSFRTVVPDL